MTGTNFRHIAKYLISCALLCSALSSYARVFEAGEVIYVKKAPAYWDWYGNDDAGKFAYFYNNITGTNAWSEEAQYVPYRGDVLQIRVPAGDWTHVIVTRNNKNDDPAWKPDWSNVHGNGDDSNVQKSADIVIPEDQNYLENFRKFKDANDHPGDQWNWSDCFFYRPSEDPASSSITIIDQAEREVVEVCTQSKGDPLSLQPRLISETAGYDYGQARTWFKWNGEKWKELPYASSDWGFSGPGGLNETIGAEGSHTYYFLSTKDPAKERFIEIAVTKDCSPTCEITDFGVVPSSVNVHDSTYTLEGVVAFGDALGKTLHISVTDAKGEHHIDYDPKTTPVTTPFIFSLSNLYADGATITATASFLNGGSECSRNSLPYPAPNAIDGIKTTIINVTHGETKTIGPEEAPGPGGYKWHDDYTTSYKRPTDAYCFDTTVIYTYYEYEPKPTVAGNLIENGDFSAGESYYGSINRTKSITGSAISEYNFWGKEVTSAGNFYNDYMDDGNSLFGGFSIVTDANSFWKRYTKRIEARKGTYYALFDADNSGEKKAWFVNTGKSSNLKLVKGTNYMFSFWVANINNYGEMNNAAKLQFAIRYKQDGAWSTEELLGNPIDLNDYQDNIWHQNSHVYTSPVDADEVEIMVRDLNTSSNPGGNDFALDDIQFQAISVHSQAIKNCERFVVNIFEPAVTVEPPVIQIIETPACGKSDFTMQVKVGYSELNTTHSVSLQLTDDVYGDLFATPLVIAPATNPTEITLTLSSADYAKLVADGNEHKLTARIIRDDCHGVDKGGQNSSTYTAPGIPALTVTDPIVPTPECDQTTFSLEVATKFAYQTGNELLFYWDGVLHPEATLSITYGPTPKDPILTKLTNLKYDGQKHTLLICTNNATLDCQDTKEVDVPFSPYIYDYSATPEQMKCDEKTYNVTVDFFVTNGQGKNITVWGKEQSQTFAAKEGKNTVTFKDIEIDEKEDYFDIWFEDAVGCTNKKTVKYKEPVTPHIEVSQGPATGETKCDAITYTVKFDIAYLNQRGKLFAWIDENDANKKEFEYKENQPTEEKVTITFTGLTGDELEHTLHAEFDGENSCSLETTYDAPFTPVISEPIKVSDPSYDCSSDKYEVELTIDYTNGLGRDIYIKEGTSVLGQFTTESDDGSHTKTIPVKLEFGTTDHSLNVFFDGLETTCPHPVTVTAVAKPSLGTINTKYITKCDKTTFDLEVEVTDFVNQDGVLSVSIDGQTVTMTPPEFIENSATPQTKTLKVEGLQADGDNTSHILSVAFVGGSHGCANNPTALTGIPHMPKISNVSNTPPEADNTTHTYKLTISVEFENPHGDLVVTDGDLLTKTISETDLTASPAVFEFSGFTFDGKAKEFNAYFTSADTCKHPLFVNEPNKTAIKDIDLQPQTSCNITTFTLNGTIEFEQGDGNLIITEVESGESLTFIEGSWANPQNFSISNIPADGKLHHLLVKFDGLNGSQATKEYKAPYIPDITKVKAEILPYACNNPNYQVRVTIEYTNSQDSDLIITDEEGHEKILKATDPQYTANKAWWTFDMPWKNPVGEHIFFAYFKGAKNCKGEDSYTEPVEPSLGSINAKYITKCDLITFDVEVEVKDFVNQDGELTVSIDDKTTTTTDFEENSATPQTRTLKLEGLQADGDNTSHILSVAFVGGSHGCANTPTALTGVPHMPSISDVNNIQLEADNTTHTYKLTGAVVFENPHGDLVITDGDALTQTISEAELTASPALFEFSGFTFDGKAKEFNAYFTSADTCKHPLFINEPNKTAIEDIDLHLQANCDQTTFTINGTITFERGSGNLSITDIESGKSLDINEGSWNSPQNFSISDIPADDKKHILLVKFDGPSGSQATKEYNALHSPAVSVTKGEPTYDCSSDKYEIELTIDYTNGLGRDIYIKEGTSVLGQFTTESDDGSHTKTIPVKLEFGTTDHSLNVFFDGLETTCPHPVTVTAVAKPSLGTINTKYITKCDKTTFDLEVEVTDFVNQDGVLSVSIDGQTVTMTPPEFIENSATPQTKTLKVEGLQADGDNTNHILSVAFVGGSHGCANTPTALTGVPHMPSISDVNNIQLEADNTTHTYKLTGAVVFENPHGDLVITDGDALTQTISEAELTASPALFEFSGFTFDGKAKEFNAYFTSADTCKHPLFVNEPNKTAIKDIDLQPQTSCNITTFTLNGTIEFEQGDGNLIITEVESRESLTFTEGSWANPQNFSISNIPADGELHHLLVKFDGPNGSQATKEYNAPASPVIHSVTPALKPEVVSGETQYHVTLSVTYSNALGKDIKVKEGGTVIKSYPVSADAGTADIQLDFDLGTNHSLKVYFDGREECAETVDIDSPITPDPYVRVKMCPGESMVWCDETIYPTEDNNEFPCDIDESHTQTLIVEFYPIPSLDERTTDTTVFSKDLPFEWEGDLYTLPGHYEKIKTTDAGDESCIYTVYLDLTVLKQTELISVDTTTCEGTPVDFYGKTYDTSGSYETDTIKGTGIDPDTVYTLNLIVYPTYNMPEETATIIDGETYTWNGTDYDIAGVYPKTLETIHKCDSNVTLNLTVLENIVENVSFNIAEQCAGEGALEIVLQHTGYLTDAQLTFSEDAIQAGFENDTFPIKNDTVIVPYNVKAGIFSVGIDLWFHSRLKYSGNAPFTLLFPSSVLEQGWMDAIFVLTHNYNGGYDFTAFQWYKKGQKLLGETGPYLYQPLEVGAEYSAMLTEQSGLQLMTCPIIIEEHTDISLHPTVVTRREMIRVSVTQNARLTMYSLMGEKVSTYAILHGDTQIEAPGTQGIYLAEVVLESGTRKVIKIMVR